MKPFIVKLSGISIAIALIGWLVFTYFLAGYYLPVMPFLLIFFYGTTIGMHAYQLKVAKKDAGKFTRTIMLVPFLKLMLYSVFAIAYIAIDKDNAIPFVACLMLLYLIFTFVEVRELIRISRKLN